MRPKSPKVAKVQQHQRAKAIVIKAAGSQGHQLGQNAAGAALRVGRT